MLDWIVPATDAVVVLLLLLIGGNLGSFLNVVVHRLPRGESVVTGGSRCPACGAAIRWHDNVPVLGWLWLGGRCRDCAAEIAPRYPLVEAVGALVLGGVAAAELLSGGGTFPGNSLAARAGADNLLLRPDPGLIGVTLFHAWLSFNLLLGAAIEADGGQVPRRWTGAVLATIVVLVAGLNWLVPVGVLGDVGVHPAAEGWRGLLRGCSVSACGMACGAVVGARGSRALRDGLVLAGGALGWQAVVFIALAVPPVAWCRRALATLLPPDPPDAGSETAESVAPVEDGGCGRPPRSSPAEEALAVFEGLGGARGRREGARGGVSGWGRLASAARDDLSRPGWTAADLVGATALQILAWRASVGLWS